MSVFTRSAISSRISGHRPSGTSAGSATAHRSVLCDTSTGHDSGAHIAMTRHASRATARSIGFGRAAEMSIPISIISSTAFGWTDGFGFVPALTPRHPAGAQALKNASAIWLRARLPSHTKRTVGTDPRSASAYFSLGPAALRWVRESDGETHIRVSPERDSVAAVDAGHLTKLFGSKPALRDVSLTVEDGEFFGLFGPNGAGKTTFVRILTGQLLPTQGTARVLGLDVLANPMAVKEAVGIVPEVESPPSYLTAYEYLYFVSRVRKVPDGEARIARWLGYFDLEGQRRTICKDLSKGTRQKLMLAAAFLHEPRLLFLDEPFINLDPIYQRKVKDYLVEYVDGGGTVFMCSHLLEIAEKLCDRVAILDEGRVIARGPLAEVRGAERDLESAFLKLVGDRR